MTMMLFSNNVNRKPSPIKLMGEALAIAIKDGALFEQAKQLGTTHYNLAQDESIVAALDFEQNQRITQALQELDKPKTSRPR